MNKDILIHNDKLIYSQAKKPKYINPSYESGYKAGRDNVLLAANPYPRKSNGASFWRCGHMEGTKERLIYNRLFQLVHKPIHRASWETILEKLKSIYPLDSWQLEAAKRFYDGERCKVIRDCYRDYKNSLNDVTRIKVLMNWNSSWSGSKRGRPFYRGEYIGPNRMPKTEAIALYKKGYSLQEIGNKAGVSRERVRQCLYIFGINQKDSPRREIKENQFFQDNQRLMDLWINGRTVKEIAIELNRPTDNVMNTISSLRSTYGLLNDPRKIKTSSDKLFAKYKVHLERWEQGVSYKKIAEEFHITVESLASRITYMRKRYGLFPVRGKGWPKGKKRK